MRDGFLSIPEGKRQRLCFFPETMRACLAFSKKHPQKITKELYHFLSEETDRFILPHLAAFFCVQYKNIAKSKIAYDQFFLPESSDSQTFREENKDLIKKIEKRNKRVIAHVDYVISLASRIENRSPISSIKLGMSDLHNNSRQVIILTDSNRKKLVWKPRKHDGESLCRKMLSCLDKEWERKILLPTPVFSSRTGNLFPYISHKFCKNPQEKQQFFRNFGFLLAVLDSLNYTDGHFENLIARGRLVSPIDLETILSSPRQYNDSYRNNIYDTGLISPESSLSALRNYQSHHFYPFDLRVLKEGSTKLEIRYKRVRNKGTSGNMPSKNAGDVGKYGDFIIKGYCDGHSLILANKRGLRKLVQQHRKKFVRRIIRPTLYYVWLTNKAFHPVFQESVIEKLLVQKLAGVSSVVQKAEINSIMKLDIPIFYSRVDSRSIFRGDGIEIQKNFFKESARSYFYKKLKMLENPSFIPKRISQIRKAIYGYEKP